MDDASFIERLLSPTQADLRLMATRIEKAWEDLGKLQELQKLMKPVPSREIEDKPTPTPLKAKQPKPVKKQSGSGERVPLQEWVNRIVRNLRLNVAAKAAHLKVSLKISSSVLDRALKHEWFEQRDDKLWQLSDAGRMYGPQLN